MTNCPNCGRPLEDGEICNCQNMAQSTVETAVMPVAASSNNGSEQQQSNTGKQGQEIVNHIKDLALGVLKSPVETTQAFMKSDSLSLSLILIGVGGLTDAILGILSILTGGYFKYYKFSDYLSSVLTDILGEIAAAALFALMIWFVSSVLFKTNFDYRKALAVFSLRELAGVPAAIISWVFRVFNISFFMEIGSWFTGAAAAFSAILMFIAIRSVMEKEKEAIYTSALAAIGTSLGYYFINLMF